MTASGENTNTRASTNAPTAMTRGLSQFFFEKSDRTSSTAAPIIDPTAAAIVAPMMDCAKGCAAPTSHTSVSQITSIDEGIVTASTAVIAPAKPSIKYPAAAQNARRLV